MAPRIRETYSALRRGSYLVSAIDDFSRTLGHTDLLAFYNLEANAGRLAILIGNGNVGDVQGCFLVDDAGFLALGLALVTLHHVTATHDSPVFLRQNLDYFTGAALVLTGQYDNLVAFTNFLHRIRSLQYFRSQRDDLHVVLSAEFARNRSEDTRADRLFLVIDKNCCVVIETDDAAVSAADVLGGTNYNRLHHVALLDAAARNS